jgi:hypothetical protein
MQGQVALSLIVESPLGKGDSNATTALTGEILDREGQHEELGALAYVSFRGGGAFNTIQ